MVGDSCIAEHTLQHWGGLYPELAAWRQAAATPALPHRAICSGGHSRHQSVGPLRTDCLHCPPAGSAVTEWRAEVPSPPQGLCAVDVGGSPRSAAGSGARGLHASPDSPIPTQAARAVLGERSAQVATLHELQNQHRMGGCQAGAVKLQAGRRRKTAGRQAVVR